MSHITHISSCTNTLTQSFFEEIISSPSVSVVETSQNKFWIQFFASACRSGSERQCDSICSLCLDLGIFLNTRFALVWIYLWAIFQFWRESDALKCGHFHNIVPVFFFSSHFHTRDNVFSPFLLFLLRKCRNTVMPNIYHFLGTTALSRHVKRAPKIE